VQLKDRNGRSAGNIDVVIVRLNKGRIVDYGAIEVQGTYISGNITNPFQRFMKDQVTNATMICGGKNLPRPDYLSSSRKRLAPQLLYKGFILNN
jgi:hypothetical protein